MKNNKKNNYEKMWAIVMILVLLSILISTTTILVGILISTTTILVGTY
jgi:hypothetical protein